MRSRFGPAAAVLALGLVASACGGGGGGGSSSSPPSGSGGGGTISLPGGISATNHGSATVTGAGGTQLEASNSGSTYFFNPTVLKGSPGQKLTVTVKNAGDTEHNFSIDDAGINQNIQPGASTTVTVTLPSSGALVFYCAFHRSLGMAGEFTTS